MSSGSPSNFEKTMLGFMQEMSNGMKALSSRVGALEDTKGAKKRKRPSEDSPPSESDSDSDQRSYKRRKGQSSAVDTSRQSKSKPREDAETGIESQQGDPPGVQWSSSAKAHPTGKKIRPNSPWPNDDTGGKARYLAFRRSVRNVLTVIKSDALDEDREITKYADLERKEKLSIREDLHKVYPELLVEKGQHTIERTIKNVLKNWNDTKKGSKVDEDNGDGSDADEPRNEELGGDEDVSRENFVTKDLASTRADADQDRMVVPQLDPNQSGPYGLPPGFGVEQPLQTQEQDLTVDATAPNPSANSDLVAEPTSNPVPVPAPAPVSVSSPAPVSNTIVPTTPAPRFPMDIDQAEAIPPEVAKWMESRNLSFVSSQTPAFGDNGSAVTTPSYSSAMTSGSSSLSSPSLHMLSTLAISSRLPPSTPTPATRSKTTNKPISTTAISNPLSTPSTAQSTKSGPSKNAVSTKTQKRLTEPSSLAKELEVPATVEQPAASRKSPRVTTASASKITGNMQATASSGRKDKENQTPNWKSPRNAGNGGKAPAKPSRGFIRG